MKTDAVLETDLCVIGAGSAGLSVAAGAVQMGARVVLIEKGAMGGDCLNTGCVPSKALLAAAKRAQAFRDSARFGVAAVEPQIDFAAVNAHVRSVIASLAPHDSQERFEGLGVTVIRAEARFVSERGLEAGGRRIRARRFVIATGSRPAVPPIYGLDRAPFLTNESLFDMTALPRRLIVIGGGPIGLEMAQAHRRLGSEVVVLEAARALAKDDPSLAAVVIARLRKEGVDLREGAKIDRVSEENGGIRVRLSDGEEIEGSHLLVATGRAPSVEGLGLEAAGVAFSAKGIETDARLRTANRRIFAIGDVAGGLQFTHVAGYHAGIVVRNALFRLPAKVSTKHIPWVTYTAPELAHVGWSEAEARERLGDRAVILEAPFEANDRARADGAPEGMLKAVFGPDGRIHGASIVGAEAGEMIQLWALAISKGMLAKDLAGMVAPYPTYGEASKALAGRFYAPRLFGGWTRWAVRQLLKLG